MSFWDNVKKFAQPYADEEYDEEYEDEMDGYEEEPARGRRQSAFAAEPAQEYAQPAQDYAQSTYAAPQQPAYQQQPAYTAPQQPQRAGGFAGTVLNMNSNKQEVVLFHAKAFDDAAKAADELMNKRAIILNMESVDKAMTRRVVDFLSGAIYALGGDVKKVAQATYLFCPHSMVIVGDLEAQAAEAVESYI